LRIELFKPSYFFNFFVLIFISRLNKNYVEPTKSLNIIILYVFSTIILKN